MIGMKARDLMTTDVTCVTVGTNLRELEKILLEKRISGTVSTSVAMVVCVWAAASPAPLPSARMARNVTISRQALSLNAPKNWVTRSARSGLMAPVSDFAPRTALNG
jgi:hypothetical protein